MQQSALCVQAVPALAQTGTAQALLTQAPLPHWSSAKQEAPMAPGAWHFQGPYVKLLHHVPPQQSPPLTQEPPTLLQTAETQIPAWQLPLWQCASDAHDDPFPVGGVQVQAP